MKEYILKIICYFITMIELLILTLPFIKLNLPDLNQKLNYKNKVINFQGPFLIFQVIQSFLIVNYFISSNRKLIRLNFNKSFQVYDFIHIAAIFTQVNFYSQFLKI